MSRRVEIMLEGMDRKLSIVVDVLSLHSEILHDLRTRLTRVEETQQVHGAQILGLKHGYDELRRGQEQLRVGQEQLRQEQEQMREEQAQMRQEQLQMRQEQEQMRQEQKQLRQEFVQFRRHTEQLLAQHDARLQRLESAL